MIEKLLKPAECSKKEIDTFYKMLINNTYIKKFGLKKRIKKAAVLLFYYDYEILAGIGAVKHPKPGYIKRIYYSANINPDIYKLNNEIGYLYIDKRYRNKGISKLITDSLIRYSCKNLFAVIRNDNNIAKRNLINFNFAQIGNKYKGKNSFYEVYFYNYTKNT